MSSVRDVEDLTRKVEAFFKANLNTQIGLVNAEKIADGNTAYSIDDINADAWYLQQLPQVWSYPCFVVWGLSKVTPDAQQEDNHIVDIEWFFEVVMPDDADEDVQTPFYKLLRYARALERVVTKNPDLIQRSYNFKVESLIPATASVAGKKFRTAGILVTTKITAQ